MKQRIKNLILISLGFISLITGVIGIFVPLLPTTVFILISAFCFANSSEKFHSWLINHKHLGPIVSNWENNRGMSAGVRRQALFSLWFGLCLSMILLWDWRVTIILSFIGLVISTYLMSLPTLKESTTAFQDVTQAQ